MALQFEKHTFNHPILGSLTGRIPLSTPSVTHFRSIPFATIPARFRQSVLLYEIPHSYSRDFTEYGKACPAQPQDDQIEAVGGLLPGKKLTQYDEFSCLNLTISATHAALGDEKKSLPVMVYVHGGAFKVGGHISAFHETTHLVDLSIREGRPTIPLINCPSYRVNWQGFMACRDLLDEATSVGEPPANFGFYDQRNAFLWIQRNIAGFGGDPKRITAFGESAGSGSIAVHMCSDVPLFQRAILLSGVPAMVPPIDLKYKKLEYITLLKYCGISEDDSERLKKLREVPVDKLIEAVNGVGILMFNSLRDKSLFPRGFPTYGWVLENGIKRVPRDLFIALSNKVLGVANASKILSAYEITPAIDQNLLWTRLMYLMGDVIFSELTHKLASSLVIQKGPHKKVYRYTMTMRNPFPGSPLHQIPGHHYIDLFFLFGTLMERYPTQRLRDLSEEFGKRWLRFGAGLEPWDEFGVAGKEDDGKIMIISGTEGFTVKSRKQNEEESKLAEEGPRRYAGWEAIGEVMDDLVSGERGIIQGEETRRRWGPDGGLFGLIGLKGPYGVVLP